MDPNNFFSGALTRFVLVVVIAILITLFLWQALEIVKPGPQYDQFCTDKIMAQDVSQEEACVAVGGKWEKTITSTDSPKEATQEVTGYCNATFTCQNQFDDATKAYSGSAFIILMIAGLVILLAGFLLHGSAVVTNGLLAGGILTIFTNSVNYWSYLFPWTKIALLGAALAVVIYFTWHKFKD